MYSLYILLSFAYLLAGLTFFDRSAQYKAMYFAYSLFEDRQVHVAKASPIFLFFLSHQTRD